MRPEISYRALLHVPKKTGIGALPINRRFVALQEV
jgi:hypothetical protein